MKRGRSSFELKLEGRFHDTTIDREEVLTGKMAVRSELVAIRSNSCLFTA
jgi:hypothetical protein